MISSRRSFLTGLGAALITAPAVVRAGSLMPVKAIVIDPYEEVARLLRQRMDEVYRVTRIQMSENLFGVVCGTPADSLPDAFPYRTIGVPLRFDV